LVIFSIENGDVFNKKAQDRIEDFLVRSYSDEGFFVMADIVNLLTLNQKIADVAKTLPSPPK